MFNNNLDFEKNSNGTTATTLAVATATSNINNSTAAATAAAATAANTVNDNSYFNRFDNRIAANLAAVINGARFRSSSCSKTTRTNANANNSNSHSHSHSTNTNTNTWNSGSNSNLNRSSFITSNHNGIATLRRSGAAAAGAVAGNTLCRQQHLDKHQQLNNDVMRRTSSPLLVGSVGRRRPMHLFTQANLNCNDNEKVAQTPSSDEDNSPTELNNCKRLADKPPLVKRLTMGLLRTNEESRPLVNSITTSITTNTTQTVTLKAHSSASNQVYSNGYINEEAFEPEKYIASKFGDSCRQSLTAIPMLDTLNLNDNSEFNLKKRYLRETSSANSSPKIFANRLRMNATHTTRYSNTTTTSSTVNNSHLDYYDDDELELKDASWFQAGISREIAVEVLASKSPGAFLVRKSSSKPGCYALTLRVPSPPGPKITNYIILRTARGYKIKGFRKEFSSLKALITHHSVMPELLPISLAMPRPTNMTSSRRNLDDFDTYDSLQMLLKYLRAKNMENE